MDDHIYEHKRRERDAESQIPHTDGQHALVDIEVYRPVRSDADAVNTEGDDGRPTILGSSLYTSLDSV